MPAAVSTVAVYSWPLTVTVIVVSAPASAVTVPVTAIVSAPDSAALITLSAVIESTETAGPESVVYITYVRDCGRGVINQGRHGGTAETCGGVERVRKDTDN